MSTQTQYLLSHSLKECLRTSTTRVKPIHQAHYRGTASLPYSILALPRKYEIARYSTIEPVLPNLVSSTCMQNPATIEANVI